ncbi:DUF983 domain-containing protein [Cognatishimia sp. SS12]|uniref:DUF983 domain-containing protein n=1 Tax=Cognatishimia sp. SS12 TaxID=2979465 RepID=UPI00232CE76D|nr:DUF983 domain-containing protein [Cognatishimia sp. SS12]MDC0737962.1 DUF983 domain-containing protein [Cognatishimia sp. SS12]
MTETMEHRAMKPALLRGLKMRCPNCGEGNVLHSYLKIEDSCSVCGEEFHHARADDGPAYVTILVVGHIMGLALTFMWELYRPSPLFMALSLSVIAIICSLLMLPRIKGMIIGYQWAHRMHGFGR